jgi:tetratricopeptide (TPR) repeat protein
VEKALEMFEKALAIHEEVGGKQGMAKIYGNMGIIHETRGDLDRACSYWQKSLDIFISISAKDKIDQVNEWIAENCLENR